MNRFLFRVLFVMTCLHVNAISFAQTDDTDINLLNPSFEVDLAASLPQDISKDDGLRGYTLNPPTGWTLAGTDVVKLLVTPECFTDNNFGKVTTIADGNQAYYLRMGWSTGTTTLSQTIQNLSAGRYELTASIRSAYANSASSTYSLFANDERTTYTFEKGSTNYFTTDSWQTAKVEFTIDADAVVRIGLTLNWKSGGSCIIIDNFRLKKVGNVDEPTEIPTEIDVPSPTEDVLTHDFIGEDEFKLNILKSLARFSQWVKNDYQDCTSPNSVGELCGCFKGENTMGNDEKGVRPNADLSMVCAFLVKYGKGVVTLPTGVSWDDIESMAMKSLVFAYSTHKANKLKTCSSGNYWGSVSASDYAWESSLWAFSVAFSAYLQWDKLSVQQKSYIEKLLKAECNYELTRSIPTGYSGDTKAEENGWEADILAATLGLFPDDALAPQWFQRLRAFAINSYSHPSDADNHTVIDPEYDDVTVADLYRGANLYSDYTLQNHNYFHTSYQTSVVQESGEAALALSLFQRGLYEKENWKTNALMHNNLKVQNEVLDWFSLSDGDVAMPNGNDWSIYLLSSHYSTLACLLKNPDALMLENMAYKAFIARQQTTTDGALMLRSDVGARRMGCEAHKMVMTYLLHEIASTKDITPTCF